MSKYKSIYCSDSDLEMLDYLVEKYGCNPSALIRRLITEAYAVQKQKKRPG